LKNILSSYLIARPLVRTILGRRPRSHATPAPAETTFLAWPPVRTQADLRTLAAKITWLLPQRAAREVVIPSEFGSPEGGFDQSMLRVTPYASMRPSPLNGVDVILLWRMLDTRVLRILGKLDRSYIIDACGPGSIELLEWKQLYERFGSPIYSSELSTQSRRNFRACADRFRPSLRQVNVFGTGPTMTRALAADLSDSINIVCNTAVLAPAFIRHTRPAIIGFLAPTFFSPSASTRHFMEAVLDCVRQFDSFVVTREGYRHFLLHQNYPELRSRIIGLSPGASPCHPTADSLVSYSTNNVLTGLLLPMALGLGTHSIQVWGCDGKDATDRRTWDYAVKPSASADDETMHPSYTARLDAMRRSRDEYEKHCRCLDAYAAYIESQGVSLCAATPSHIPALAARQVIGEQV
jgi:hypothetical protein